MIIKPTYTVESIEEQHIDDFDQTVIENLVLKYGSDNLFHSMVERNQLFENEDIEEAYSLNPHEYGGNFNSDTDFSNFTKNTRINYKGEEFNVGVRNILQIQDVSTGKTYIYDSWNDKFKSYGKGPKIEDILKYRGDFSEAIQKTIEKFNPKSSWLAKCRRREIGYEGEKQTKKDFQQLLKCKTLYEFANFMTGGEFKSIKTLSDYKNNRNNINVKEYTKLIHLAPYTRSPGYIYIFPLRDYGNYDENGNHILIPCDDKNNKSSQYVVLFRFDEHIFRINDAVRWCLPNNKTKYDAMYYYDGQYSSYHIDNKIGLEPFIKYLGKLPYLTVVAISRYLQGKPDITMKNIKDKIDMNEEVESFWSL